MIFQKKFLILALLSCFFLSNFLLLNRVYADDQSDQIDSTASIQSIMRGEGIFNNEFSDLVDDVIMVSKQLVSIDPSLALEDQNRLVLDLIHKPRLLTNFSYLQSWKIDTNVPLRLPIGDSGKFIEMSQEKKQRTFFLDSIIESIRLKFEIDNFNVVTTSVIIFSDLKNIKKITLVIKNGEVTGASFLANRFSKSISRSWRDLKVKVLDNSDSIKAPIPKFEPTSLCANKKLNFSTVPRVRDLKIKTTIVAVVDSGVDYNYDALMNQILKDTDACLIGWDFVHNDGLPFDVDGHGTHIAGIIAAKAPELSILPIHFAASQQLSAEPKYYKGALENPLIAKAGKKLRESQYKSIQYAASNGARVVNMSFTDADASCSSLSASNKCSVEGYRDAIKDFKKLVFVVAAGNAESENQYKPLDLDQVPNSMVGRKSAENIITVAATDKGGNLASFSYFGQEMVDLAAEGVDIESFKVNGGMVKMSGTSMAAPQVSRTVGRMLSVNDELTPGQIKSIICETVDRSPQLFLLTRCGGILNEARAIQRADSLVRVDTKF